MRELSFTVIGKPQPKERARRDPRSGRWFTPKATRAYEKLVRETAYIAAGRARFLPITRACEVTMRIFWPDRRRRDGDNVVKSILDGLQPQKRRGSPYGWGLFADDSQVTRHTVEEAIDRERPRVEVTVRVIEDGEAA